MLGFTKGTFVGFKYILTQKLSGNNSTPNLSVLWLFCDLNNHFSAKVKLLSKRHG